MHSRDALFFFEHTNGHREPASSADRNESSDGDVEWRPSESCVNLFQIAVLFVSSVADRSSVAICKNSFSSHFRCQHDLSIRQLYVRFVSPFDLSMQLSFVFGRHCAYGSASSNHRSIHAILELFFFSLLVEAAHDSHARRIICVLRALCASCL